MKNAAIALGRLALNSEETQMAIAKAGAINFLVDWLTTDAPLGPGMIELAARSLADIASENWQSSQRIVDAGAVVPLIKMLENGRGSDAQKSASGCLATLTKANFLRPEGAALPEISYENGKSGAAATLVTVGPDESAHSVEGAADDKKHGIPDRVWEALANNMQRAIDVFRKLDADKSGRLERIEFVKGMSECVKEADKADLETLFKECDLDGSGEIEYNELFKTISRHRVRVKEKSTEIAKEMMPLDPLLTADVIAKSGGIPPLVELLKSERAGPHENASRAVWQLANLDRNRLAIAAADGITPLVSLLTAGSEATQRHAAAAMESLAKDCPDNQLALAKAKAIAPLVTLLGSESMETQEHSVGALLYLATHVDCRNAVVRRLVTVLDLRNANAQLRAAGALAALSSRNVTYRNAIYEAGAIPPLVRQLGDGLRVENDTPQERAACVLADLARSGDSKEDIVAAGGVLPLVRMLGSASHKAQTAACVVMCHLACNGEYKIEIVISGGIKRLVEVLATENREARRPATGALAQLADCSENKMEIVQNNGIPLLVQVMRDDPQTQESAVEVLAELAKSKLPQKQAIVAVGGIEVICQALKEGTAGAQKFAAAATWGLAAHVAFTRSIVDEGAVPPLVNLLKASADAQGYAVAALSLLAEIGEGKKQIFISQGVEHLLEIAKGAERAWLRSTAVDVLALLNIKDPLGGSDINLGPGPASPRTPRTARGVRKDEQGADDACAAAYEAPDDSRDPATVLMQVATNEVMEVVATTKPLQLRAGFDLNTEKVGELLPKKAIHIIEERMTDDGKTRMCVAAEGSIQPLGWVTGRSADNKSNLREVGRPVMEVIASKSLVARENFDTASKKVTDLASGAYVHLLEARQTTDGAYRIAYAMEGRDAIKGWVTAIAKTGELNLSIGVAEKRRATTFSPGAASPEAKEAKVNEANDQEKVDQDEEERLLVDAPSPGPDHKTAAPPQQEQRSARRASMATTDATPRAASSKPDGEISVTTGKLKMRAGCDLNSDEAGYLAYSSRVVLLERTELPDGTKRARIGRESDGALLGWVSLFAKDGSENLNCAAKPGTASTKTHSVSPKPTGASSPKTTGVIPSKAKTATIGSNDTFLPPTKASSGTLTARSTVEAAAAGASKNALP